MHLIATLIASATAAGGFLLATLFYGLHKLDAADVKRQFNPIYHFLVHKWYFDELYAFIFIKPLFFVSSIVSKFDKNVIDIFIDKLAVGVKAISKVHDAIDRYVVDGFVNVIGNWTYSAGRSLKAVQTGKLRQYVMFIVVGTVVLTVIMQWALAAE